jgi:hypothetical protein
MKKTYQGGCHCGAVRFAADIDLAGGTFRCNCSICFKTRAWMAFVPADAFRLVAGKESLGDYQFGKRNIHHLFCVRCGVRSFARAMDENGNPAYALRVNCLDGVEAQDLAEAPVVYMDGLHDDIRTSPVEIRHL